MQENAKFEIDAQLINDIGNYLAGRPWAEVNALIYRLQAVATSPLPHEKTRAGAKPQNDG
jgi:hypothetical protein